MNERVIENEGPGEIWVWEIGEYEDSSVLAGQTRRARLDCFDTVEEAQKAYPDATVSEGCSLHAQNVMDRDSFAHSLAPGWFDPADAGERWDDDY